MVHKSDEILRKEDAELQEVESQKRYDGEGNELILKWLAEMSVEGLNSILGVMEVGRQGEIKIEAPYKLVEERVREQFLRRTEERGTIWHLISYQPNLTIHITIWIVLERKGYYLDFILSVFFKRNQHQFKVTNWNSL